MAREKVRKEILDLVAGYSSTAVGERAVYSLKPDYTRAKADLSDVALILSEYEKGMSLSFPQIPDVSEVFSYLERYGTLNGEKLVVIARFVDKVLELRERIHSNRLARHINVPTHLLRLSRDIKENLSPSGEVRTDRHSTLADLIRRRNEIRERLLALYADLIRRHQEKLRERQPVIKGGRLSLAVVSNYKIDGIVHGYSATTETIFVEPYEVVPVQNALVQVEDQIREYEARIIKALSSRAIRSIDLIRRLYESVGRLDSLFARARFAVDFKATIPKFGRRLRLVGAREPVLYRVKRGRVVPLDLEMDRFALLITGPNAGGKTVALRTVAFAVLMASMGIPVPADEVEVPEGASVYMLGFEAEGDVRAGLSNFTSELQHLKEIVANAEGGDVVLFDEVFASTDPDEASVLAYSVAKFFSDRGIYILMSTHFSTLKLLAKTSEFFTVATVENYKLVPGKVGESGGLRTARAFLPPEIVSYAEELLKEVPSYVVRLKEEYERKLRKLSKEREEVRRALREVRAALSERRDVRRAYDILEEVAPKREVREGEEYFVKSLGVKGKVVKVEGDRVKVKVRNFLVEVKREDLL